MLLRFVKSNFFLVLELAVVVIVLIGFFNIQAKENSIQEEIAYLTSKVDSEKQQNKVLKDRLVKTDNAGHYIELEARRKLNYKKPEETVFVFYEEADVPIPLVSSKTVESQGESIAHNPVKWWRYFFLH